MPEFRVKVYLTETYEAEFVVSAEDDDHVEHAVADMLKKDEAEHIEWELHDDSFEVIEASEV